MRILVFAVILSIALGRILIKEKGVKILPIRPVVEPMESDEKIIQLLIEKGEAKSKQIEKLKNIHPYQNS